MILCFKSILDRLAPRSTFVQDDIQKLKCTSGPSVVMNSITWCQFNVVHIYFQCAF